MNVLLRWLFAMFTQLFEMLSKQHFYLGRGRQGKEKQSQTESEGRQRHGVLSTHAAHSSCETPGWQRSNCKWPNDPDKICRPSSSLASTAIFSTVL